MQKAPVMKSSGLAPIDDEPVHVFGRNLEARVIESKQEDPKEDTVTEKRRDEDDGVEAMKRRKFETTTGEEEEETAFQGDFKLFIWDKATSNWTEKGRGQLKLNDSVVSDEPKSRLIMRTGGTYRIILNVAIQHSFFKVIANTKTSIRFTDSQNVWAASGSNAKSLGDLIEERLSIAAEQANKKEQKKKSEELARSERIEDNVGEKESEATEDKVAEVKAEETARADVAEKDKSNVEPVQDTKESEEKSTNNDEAEPGIEGTAKTGSPGDLSKDVAEQRKTSEVSQIEKEENAVSGQKESSQEERKKQPSEARDKEQIDEIEGDRNDDEVETKRLKLS